MDDIVESVKKPEDTDKDIGDDKDIYVEEVTDDDVLQTYLTNLASNHPKYDTVFGVRMGPGDDLYIGKYIVEFKDGKITLYSGNKKMKEYVGVSNMHDAIFLRDVEPLDSVRDR